MAASLRAALVLLPDSFGGRYQVYGTSVPDVTGDNVNVWNGQDEGFARRRTSADICGLPVHHDRALSPSGQPMMPRTASRNFITDTGLDK